VIALLSALCFVSFLPAINLRLNLDNTLGERFLYLPTVFACMLIAYLGSLLIRDARAFLLFLVALLAFYSLSLQRTNAVWREAAQVTHVIVNQLTHAAAPSSVIVINAPDNLRGVPVFHNGLPEAVQWFASGKSVIDLRIVAFQDLQSPSDQVRLDEGDPITITAVSSADKFSRVQTTECFEPSSPAAGTLTLYRKPCAALFGTVFYSDGRMNRLQGGSSIQP